MRHRTYATSTDLLSNNPEKSAAMAIMPQVREELEKRHATVLKQMVVQKGDQWILNVEIATPLDGKIDSEQTVANIPVHIHARFAKPIRFEPR